ncbi:hypothetical protein C8J57DRAFT_1317518 [Mycena rebaudengoi]|nr:hypothetical protein C8J57DRAFT_1317518 [Mycena rebaudengoi]
MAFLWLSCFRIWMCAYWPFVLRLPQGARSPSAPTSRVCARQFFIQYLDPPRPNLDPTLPHQHSPKSQKNVVGLGQK